MEEELRRLHLRLPSSSHRCLPTPSIGSPFGSRTKTIAIHIFGFLSINVARNSNADYFLDQMRFGGGVTFVMIIILILSESGFELSAASGSV